MRSVVVKHLVGLGACVATLLVGALIAASPFAVGTQPDGAALTLATLVTMAGGIAVLALGLLGLGIHLAAIIEEARRSGAASTSGWSSPPPGQASPSPAQGPVDAAGSPPEPSPSADATQSGAATSARALGPHVRERHQVVGQG